MRLRSLVGGKWVEGIGPDHRDENPARPRQTVATYRSLDSAAVDTAADAAAAAARPWRATPIHERAAVLAAAADALDDRRDVLGRELTEEEGKTLREGVGEVARAARILRFYAAEADRSVGDLFSSPHPGERILTRQVPVGPVALITPWNFPIAIPAWKLAPALVFGNPIVWKPSPVTPRLAVRFAEVLLEAGLHEGVLNVLLGDAAVAQQLLTHREIRACSFTGSTRAGCAVAATAAARGVKIQAEMGSVNTAVVFSDADLDVAAGQIASGAMASTGQKCTATSRVVVEAAVHDSLLEGLVRRCEALVVGDPLDASTDLGPVATRPQLSAIREALAGAHAAGAEVILDGKPTCEPDAGYFVGPSVVSVTGADTPAFTDEIFGPLVAVASARDREEAFKLANGGQSGLSAAVFTRDLGVTLEAIDHLEVGVVHVNRETSGAEPHVPFGGVKSSGLGGRELGRAARDFYTEAQTIYLAPAAERSRER